MKRRLLILLPLAVLSAGQHAQDTGYKITRPDGTVEFTDRPSAGAQQITLPKSQGYQAPPPPAAAPAAPPAEPAGVPYRQFAIVAPQPEQTIPSGENSVTVTVALEPALRPGHEMVILLDGKEVARGAASDFSLAEVERGSHALSAEVRDAQDAVVQSSPPVTFHMRQHSTLFPKPPLR